MNQSDHYSFDWMTGVVRCRSPRPWHGDCVKILDRGCVNEDDVVRRRPFPRLYREMTRGCREAKQNRRW